VSVKPDDMRALARKARAMPPAEAAFKQKRLNLWVDADTPWLSLEGWRLGQSRWDPADMAGERCWLGVDLSSKIDLTAVVALFPPTETRRHWRVLARCLTPAETLEERARRDRAPYAVWVSRGWLETNPGNQIDQDAVRDIVLDLHATYQVQEIGIDPWNAGNLRKHLENDGLRVVEIPQTLPQMSSTCKDFEADVLDGLVDANHNDLLQWAVRNTVVAQDNKDNLYPTKKRSRGRIDPVIALLLARKMYNLQLGTPADDPDLVTA
jgi:phage terminase large subunit-like protein